MRHRVTGGRGRTSGLLWSCPAHPPGMRRPVVLAEACCTGARAVVLHADVGGLLGHRGPHQKLQLVDDAAFVQRSAAPVVAAVNRGPRATGGASTIQVVSQAGHRFFGNTTASALPLRSFELGERPCDSPLRVVQGPQFSHHAPPRLTAALVACSSRLARLDRGEPPHRPRELLSGWSGEVESHQALFPPVSAFSLGG